MSEIRQRTTKDPKEVSPESADSNIDSEDDKQHTDLSKDIPTGTDKAPSILASSLEFLPERWRNWVIRGIFSLVMISFFGIVIYIGPIALMFTTLLVQVKCFAEIINIGYSVYRVHGLPWFRSLSWYFLITSNYFFYGESLVDYSGEAINRLAFLRAVVSYHRFISFSLYCLGFVWFVLSLKKRYYMKQFSLFAWTHVALLIVVLQSYLIIKNIFEGLVWFIVPVSMIICNDIMAYMFGFFFGKTPLIQLSPKKTWEGFIGGGFSTVVFGFMLSTFMARLPYFVCPVAYNETVRAISMDCEPGSLFQSVEFILPQSIAGAFAIIGAPTTFNVVPFALHSLSLSVFSSVIGPFGGFFASGFKRAFKIKDFGDVIPGHGGIMDRFDCQFLMATFVNVYITSFIVNDSPQKLLSQILYLKPDQQLELFNMLRSSLLNRGVLEIPN